MTDIKVSTSENTFVETTHYFLESYVYDHELLLVTFEPFGSRNERSSGLRPGWGSSFFRKRGISHLSVKPRFPDWYRKPDLVEAFTSLRDDGFFARFGRVMTYGGSMGGFGALVYADLIGADEVLSLNPQTTLHPRKAPWDHRFNFAKKNLNWNGPFSDAANELNTVSKIHFVYDKRHTVDRNHINRLPPRILNKSNLINLPYLGHHIPLHLAGLGLLQPLLNGVMTQNFDSQSFYQAARKRRDLKRYFNSLEGKARVKDSATFQKIIKKHKEISPLLGME